MIKRTVVLAVVFALLCFNVAPMGYAQTSTSGPVGTATVTVVPTLELTLVRGGVVKMSVANGDTNPFTQGTVLTTTSFNFGDLVPVTNASGVFQYMRGQFYYYALMVAASSGRRYKITESGDQLSGTGGLLPREGVLLVPDYNWADALVFDNTTTPPTAIPQGAPPTGAFLGPVTTACSSTESLVYQSDTNGLGRLVRAILVIGGPPAGSNYPFNYSQGFNGSGVGQGAKQEYTSWKPITKDQPAGSYTGQLRFTLTLN